MPRSPQLKQTQLKQAELLQRGLALHQQGKLLEAGAAYESVLKQNPSHFDALHLLGIIASQSNNHQLAGDLIAQAIALYPNNAAFYANRGIALQALKQFDAAVASYDKAISLKPDHAQAYFNRGDALQVLKKFDAAVASYDKVIDLNPDSVEAYANRGNALQELKQFDAAVGSYDKAIALKPDSAEAHSNRGLALHELKKFDAAIVSFDRAIALNPDSAQAYYNRGNSLQELKQFDAAVASYDRAIGLKSEYAEAHYNRGNSLQELKQFDAAVASYENAVSIRPEYAEAHSNLGDALQAIKQFDAALTCYNKAIDCRPEYAEAYANRGVALKELKQFEASVASYDRAIQLKPDYAEAFSNRGIALENLNQFTAAIASYEKAISLKPDYAEAYWNKSLALLLRGDFAKGWPLYEWRWKNEISQTKLRNFTQPLWLGQASLQGKTILLHSEQGLGDTIQFCRYAKVVKELGARVVMEVPEPLMGLFSGIEGVDELMVKGSPLPDFDFHCPLLSLPLAFQTTLANIPRNQAYLTSLPNKVVEWKVKLGPQTKRRVGLVWSGSTGHKNDHNRSLTFDGLSRYLSNDFEYICLQKEMRDWDKESLKKSSVQYFGDEVNDFTDTAALCELVDVVISVDTSVAHLAAALGKPTWVLLPFAPDWRWLLDIVDSPWYESMRLYRQDADRDWAGVVKRVGNDLNRWLKSDTLLARQPQGIKAVMSWPGAQ